MRRWMLSWLRSRKAILGLILFVGLGLGGFFAWKKWNHKLQASLPIAALDPRIQQGFPYSAISGIHEKRVPMAITDATTYDDLESLTRLVYRTALDIEWKEWTTANAHFKPPGRRLKFDGDQMAAPLAEETTQDIAQTPIVRMLPYPFHSALSVPSDACGSTSTDPYYMHTLLSRKHGLDLPSSFFPYSSDTSNNGLSVTLFSGSSSDPVRFPYQVESEQIDALPLLLTYYHRGWLDHIHDWSAGSTSPLSLIEPISVAAGEDGEGVVDLLGLNRELVTWCGLEMRIELSGKVDGFEMELIDRAGISHFVVYKRELKDRSGWNLSALTLQQLTRCHVLLSDEKNASPVSSFGKQQAGPIRSGKVRMNGEKGARVRIQSIGAVDLSRGMVLAQMRTMKRFNLLPSVATYHGGANSWATLFEPASQEIDDPASGKKVLMERPAHAQSPDSPTYIADALRDFGICHFNNTNSATHIWKPAPAIDDSLKVATFQDQKPYYRSHRFCFCETKDTPLPNLTDQWAHAENLGPQLANSLVATNRYGDARVIYTHFNYYNGKSFDPPRNQTIHLHEIKHLEPFSEEVLTTLSNLMYNVDGKRPAHQRVWVTPLASLLRFAQARQQLAKNVVLEDNTVRIAPWKDPVTNSWFPDPSFVSLDLHGQTFYVKNAKSARVFVNGKEITALQRNAADFSNRESVTIVDTHCPTVILDEVDFFETNGRLQPDGASYYFQQRHAYSGKYAAEVQLERDGKGTVCWKPYLANNHETSHLRFAYKKTNPKSRVIVGWSQEGETPQFIATDGNRNGLQGWEIPCHDDTDYHEVVVSYADMLASSDGKPKVIPRGRVKNFYIGLVGEKGDSIFFDKIEFLSARGLRPHSGDGLLVGGRIHPPRDGEPVRLNIMGDVREAITDRGGWYFFHNVPVGAIAEITFQRAGVTYWPARGRLAQIEKNDIEHHIFALDPRSPSIPRPEFGKQKVPKALGPQIVSDTEPLHGNTYQPHSRRFYANNIDAGVGYLVEDWVNNRGWMDKDRRTENPDGSLRLFLSGACLEEGAQTPVRDHLNVVLESMLRRRTGINVEVAVASHSSSSIAANSYLYEKYGRSLKPDFVVLMNEPVHMWHLEPTLMEKYVGWTRGHSPYRSFDFDDNGRLVEFPPDPGYAVFAKKVDWKPLVDNLHISWTYSLLSEYPPAVEKSFQLFQAIAHERFVKDLKTYGGRLIVASGSFANDYPYRDQTVGTGKNQLAAAKYFQEMRRVTESAGGLFVDLSAPVLRFDFGEVMSYGNVDGHLTPTGHYLIAKALADRLLELPEFQEAIQRKRKASPTVATK